MSVADTRMVCQVSSCTDTVFQSKVYGYESSVNNSSSFKKHSTNDTSILSIAVIEMCTIPLTVCPAEGSVITTAGGSDSVLSTKTDMGDGEAEFPLMS